MGNVGRIDAEVGLNLNPLARDATKTKQTMRNVSDTMKKELSSGAKSAEKAIGGIGQKTVKVGQVINTTSGKAKTSLKGIGESAERVSNKLKNVIRIGAAAAGVALVGLGAKAIQLGSDFEETNAKFNTAFKGIEKQAKQTSEVLAASYNLSKTESQKLLSGTGDLLKGFGFTASEALKLSNNVQELSSDLSSYNNLQGGTTRASEILTKAMLGERDALVSLGIKISDADVKQKLLEQGLNDLTGQALLAARAQATFELALAQSGDALGDTARSADTFKTQTNILKANIADLGTELGKKLLPAANAATKALNNFFNVIGVNEIRSVNAEIEKLEKELDDLLGTKDFELLSNENKRDAIRRIQEYEAEIDVLTEKLEGLKLNEVEDVKIVPAIDETETEKAANKLSKIIEESMADINFNVVVDNLVSSAQKAAMVIQSEFEKRGRAINPTNRINIVDTEFATEQQTNRIQAVADAHRLASSVGKSDIKMKIHSGEIEETLVDISNSFSQLGNNLKSDFLSTLGVVVNNAGAIIQNLKQVQAASGLGAAGGILGIVTAGVGIINSIFGNDDRDSLDNYKVELDKVTESTDKATNSLKDMSAMLFNISDAVSVDILRARTYAKFSQQGTVNGQIDVVVRDSNGNTINRSQQRISPLTGTGV